MPLDQASQSASEVGDVVMVVMNSQALPNCSSLMRALSCSESSALLPAFWISSFSG